jgi:hypothetical protein
MTDRFQRLTFGTLCVSKDQPKFRKIVIRNS